MDIFSVIECVIIVASVFYVSNLIVVWAYELRRNSSYRQMQEQVRQLESFRLSAAVLHAKTYRVLENYRKDVLNIERVQQFILGNLLFINKKSQRNISICGVISMSAGR